MNHPDPDNPPSLDSAAAELAGLNPLASHPRVRDPVNVVPIGAARERAMPHAQDIADMTLHGTRLEHATLVGVDLDDAAQRVFDGDGELSWAEVVARSRPWVPSRQAPRPSFREHVDAYLEGLLPRSTFARLVVGGVLAFAAGVAIAALVKAVSP